MCALFSPPSTNLSLAAVRCFLASPLLPCVAPSLQGNMGVADVDSSEPQKGELKMSSDYPQETVPEAESPRKPQPPKVSKSQMVRAAIASCCLFATLIVIVLLTAKMVEPIFHRAQLERLRVACVPEPYERQRATASSPSLRRTRSTGLTGSSFVTGMGCRSARTWATHTTSSRWGPS